MPSWPLKHTELYICKALVKHLLLRSETSLYTLKNEFAYKVYPG